MRRPASPSSGPSLARRPRCVGKLGLPSDRPFNALELTSRRRDPQILAKLVAHTRQHGLFASFAAQITLLQAYLAHSTAQSAAALDLYRAAAHLALVSSAPAPHPGGPERAELAKAARLGEAGLLVGLGRAGEVGKDVRALAKDVWGASGAASTGGEARRDENVGLRIAGGLVLGVLQDEILRSKCVHPRCSPASVAVVRPAADPPTTLSPSQAVHEVVPRPVVRRGRQLVQADHPLAHRGPLCRASSFSLAPSPTKRPTD